MKKNKVKNKSFKIALGLFIFFFICSFLCVNINVNASESYSDMSEKIYANVDISDDFDDSSVVVILDKSISGINKVHNETLFSNIEFEEINDLTYVTDVSTIKNKENFEQILEIKLKYPSKENVIEMIEELILLDGIKYAGPNRYFSIEEVPNDPLYSTTIPSGGQWAHNNIQSENAWDFTTGNRNVRIGVIDTGVSSHPDLNANLDTGFDFVYMIDEDTPGPLRNDLDGHGTHVAGIIGAVGNQATPTGIVGVNWEVTIVPMQVATITGSIDSNACIRAINYARDTWNSENRISILSMSIGWYNEWPEIETAIRAYQGLFVCSTGNKNQNNDLEKKHHYPSFYASDMHTDPIPNMIAVGRSDINDTRPLPPTANANWGARTITIYAPGQNIISTVPLDLCNLNGINCGIGAGHREHGYHSMSGSSMATPHVSGVAALLLSLNEDLTTLQLREAIIESADDITIQVENDVTGVLENQNVIRLNAYNAVRYVLENYMNPTTYTLSNYSSTINTNKTIASDASYFDELNGFYKLNVTYAKSYEFISSSTSGIEVTLYDEDFTEIPFNDLDSTVNKVHFIESLSTGTYYLRTKYANEENTGTINTQIVSRTTAYIGIGDNDVLLNTHNYNEGIYTSNYYYYINNRGVGFYRFTLTGVKADGTTVTYPYSSIMIKDHMNEDIIDKYSLTGYSNQAISGQNENTFVAYLNATGYFYVYIDIDTEGLKSLILNIEPVESETIDLFTKSESTNSTIEILDSETTKGDYAKKIILKQAGEFTVNYSYSGSQSSDILFVLSKLNYNSTTQKYTIETLISQLMDAENDSFTYTLDLTDGTYFVAYFNKDDNAAFDVTFNRLVTQYGGSVLIPDPDSVTDGGSQVEVYEKGLPYYEVSYRGTNIVIGFTRVIYIDYHYVNQNSREDYYWYSSNDSIASVSQHGTVFGKSAGTVKIMAVNKDDPSIVFVKQFTVVQDTKTYSEVIYSEFNDTHKLSKGEYQLGLDVQNSPYPMTQYYSWRVVSKSSTITSVSIDQWGNVTITGTGNVVIEGYNYIYNNNYGVRINLTVTN